VQRGLSESGHTVFAITPTASAAGVLRNQGFGQAATVEDFLRNSEKQGGLQNAVVICDEAGLKSNRQGTALLRMAQKHNMRVLLVGDVRQHVSVEAGDSYVSSKRTAHSESSCRLSCCRGANGRRQYPRRSGKAGPT
jgi:ATP-dependent exoDNAse (exonuclease V) alpha subunit